MLRKINNMRIDAQESEAARLAASGIDGRNEVIPSGAEFFFFFLPLLKPYLSTLNSDFLTYCRPS